MNVYWRGNATNYLQIYHIRLGNELDIRARGRTNRKISGCSWMNGHQRISDYCWSITQQPRQKRSKSKINTQSGFWEELRQSSDCIELKLSEKWEEAHIKKPWILATAMEIIRFASNKQRIRRGGSQIQETTYHITDIVEFVAQILEGMWKVNRIKKSQTFVGTEIHRDLVDFRLGLRINPKHRAFQPGRWKSLAWWNYSRRPCWSRREAAQIDKSSTLWNHRIWMVCEYRLSNQAGGYRNQK